MEQTIRSIFKKAAVNILKLARNNKKKNQLGAQRVFKTTKLIKKRAGLEPFTRRGPLPTPHSTSPAQEMSLKVHAAAAAAAGVLCVRVCVFYTVCLPAPPSINCPDSLDPDRGLSITGGRASDRGEEEEVQGDRTQMEEVMFL